MFEDDTTNQVSNFYCCFILVDTGKHVSFKLRYKDFLASFSNNIVGLNDNVFSAIE